MPQVKEGDYMTLSQAIRYLKSSGFSEEQVHDIISAIILDFIGVVQSEANYFLNYTNYLYAKEGEPDGEET